MPSHLPTRRPVAVAVAAAALLALTACGGGESGGAGTTETKRIAISFDGDQVTPSGERIAVGVNQPIELDVTADKPGEIHVHSDPEQELSYDAGSTTLELKPIDRPGVVEVESHTLEETIVQLEVR